MRDVPHPQVGPAEPQDWQPALDRELSRLPEKYRRAIVLCDLQGYARREASRQLSLVGLGIRPQQHVGHDKPEHAVAQKFKTLVAALAALARQR